MRPGTENSVRDLESPLEPYICIIVCEGSGQEIKMQTGTRHEVDNYFSKIKQSIHGNLMLFFLC